MSEQEEWRTIPGHVGYEVSSLGRVRSADGVETHQSSGSGDYLTVSLRGDGGRSNRRVHQLVLLAFVGPRPEGLLTRHLNGIPSDNRLANLAYGTPLENNLDTVRHGANENAAKTHCPEGHEYTPENTARWKTYRYCRICSADHKRRSRERQRARKAQAA